MTIPATDAYDTVLRYPGLAISGVVVDVEGQPVEGVAVRRLGGPGFARSGADGGFVLAGLDPGVYRLQARAGDGTSAVVEVTLEAERRPDPVELVLGPEQPDLAVSVRTDTGLPAAGALVFLESPGRPLRILTTDADGRATTALRPPAPPRLRAAAHHRGVWVLGEWTDTATASAEDLTLRLPESGSLQVVSEEAAGRLSITAPGGWDLTSLLSWLGTPPAVTPSSPLLLPGLPPGRYALTLAGAAGGDRPIVAEVETAEAATVDID